MKALSTIIIAILACSSFSAEAADKFRCTDYFNSTYVLSMAVTSCIKSTCTLKILQNDSPSGCEPFDQNFEVKASRRGSLYKYRSELMSITVNSAKAPSRRLLQKFSRPYGTKNLFRGQARFPGPFVYPTPGPSSLPCSSELREKYSQLVCIIEGK